MSGDGNCDSRLIPVRRDGNAPASGSGGCVSLSFSKLGTGEMRKGNTQFTTKKQQLNDSDKSSSGKSTMQCVLTY